MLSLLIQQLQGDQPAPVTPRATRKPFKGTVEKYRKALVGVGWCDMQQVSDRTGVSVGGLHRTIEVLIDHGYLECKLGPPGPFKKRPIFVRWL